MGKTPVSMLEEYVNQPSGTLDKADVEKMAEIVAADFASLGFSVERIPGMVYGPTLKCVLGTGARQIMLMGHMDTVFPHEQCVKWQVEGDKALGSGVTDMKGGVVILLHAVKKALPDLDLSRVRLCAVINPDEEVGSPESHEIILNTAKASCCALSFEPAGENGRLTCARKGVTSVLVSCDGIPGHAGAKYKECASAIQALCAQITRLYSLRDDSRDISFNAGLITGGTAENVVAPSARCKCEFRYFNEAYKPELIEKIKAICAEEPVPGAHTTVTFGASHPAIDINEKSGALYAAAETIARNMGLQVCHERTGGAGDIAIAGQAGIGVLDGLGMEGGGMHTREEWANLACVPQKIQLAAELIRTLARE